MIYCCHALKHNYLLKLYLCENMEEVRQSSKPFNDLLIISVHLIVFISNRFLINVLENQEKISVLIKLLFLSVY